MKRYVLDHNLERFATHRQWEVLTKLGEVEFQTECALLLGVSVQYIHKVIKAVDKKAAAKGYAPECDLTHPIADGLKLRGTSGLYRRGEEEPVLQWVKTSADHERQQEMMREAIEALTEDLPKISPTKSTPPFKDDLMACFPVGDLHLGMYSCAAETGEDWDLEKGEKILMAAIDALIDASPPCGTAAIVILGDFLHFSSYSAVTPKHRNQLDASGRFPEIVQSAIRLIRWMIQKTLSRHDKVNIIITEGNHDDASAMFLRACIANIYSDEPRISVDNAPTLYHYLSFGKCLIGAHHGHRTKLDSLPLLMATTQPEAWGRSQYRYFWTGHVHHQNVKEFNGAVVESFGVLAPQDAHAVGGGYSSKRSMKAIIMHKEHGEVARHTVNPKMLGF